MNEKMIKIFLIFGIIMPNVLRASDILGSSIEEAVHKLVNEENTKFFYRDNGFNSEFLTEHIIPFEELVDLEVAEVRRDLIKSEMSIYRQNFFLAKDLSYSLFVVSPTKKNGIMFSYDVRKGEAFDFATFFIINEKIYIDGKISINGIEHENVVNGVESRSRAKGVRLKNWFFTATHKNIMKMLQKKSKRPTKTQ